VGVETDAPRAADAATQFVSGQVVELRSKKGSKGIVILTHRHLQRHLSKDKEPLAQAKGFDCY